MLRLILGAGANLWTGSASVVRLVLVELFYDLLPSVVPLELERTSVDEVCDLWSEDKWVPFSCIAKFTLNVSEKVAEVDVEEVALDGVDHYVVGVSVS